MEKIRLKSTSKYPTTLIVKGLNTVGIEIAKTLVEQGGYVIILDEMFEGAEILLEDIPNNKMISLLDIVSLKTIEDELRRLDYIFYFAHETKNFLQEISTQDFLQESNYLDAVLDLGVKFESKFLLTTSIKAHQISLENKEVLHAQKSQSVSNEYTSTEIQRYAENLTKEYGEKTELDTRIIRIGEILGEGVNPLTEAYFMNLIVAYVNDDPLEIPGDGLETDFYVHHLDVSRGLIKAMFSYKTKGKTYSLSIPEEISILSIAYKLAEQKADPPEIKFVENNSKLPPLRLYQPATNLVALGFDYKVSLDRAIKTTIDYIDEREKRLKEDSEINKNESNYAYDEKIEDKTPETKNAQGALGRLIAERKMHEKSRKGSVVLANEELRKKMRFKDMSFQEKIYNKSSKVFDNLKKKFKFLKYITLREFIFYLIIGFAGILLYLYILSPIANIAGNSAYAYIKINDAYNQLQNEDLEQASASFEDVSESYTNIQERLADLNFVFTAFGLNETYTEYQDSLSTQNNFFDGLHTSYSSIYPIYNYLNEPNNTLITRISDETIVDIQESSEGNAEEVIANTKTNFQFGVEKLRVAENEIDQSTAIIPDFLMDNLDSKFDYFESRVDILTNLYQNYEYAEPLLGIDSRTSYLFMIQDNSRYTGGGGYISAYAMVTIENGRVTFIKVNDIHTTQIENININENLESDVNLVSPVDIGSRMDTNELSLVKDTNLQSELTKEMFESTFGRNIDVVVWLNLTSLKSLLGENEVEINNISINENNFENNLNLISGEEIDQKDRAIAQIFGEILVNTFNKPRIIDTSSTIGKMLLQSDAKISSFKPSLKTFIDQFKNEKITGADFLEFGINQNNEQTNNLSKTINLTGKIEINEDFSTEKENIEISLPNQNNLNSIWMCIPPGSSNIQAEANRSNYSVNFSSQNICILIVENQDENYSIDYNSLNFDNEQITGYNYIFQLIKPEGLNVNYELEFIFNTSETIVSEVSPTIERTNNFTFSGELENSINFKFNINE